MEKNPFRQARKQAAAAQPLLNNCDSAQTIVGIERTRLLNIENDHIIPHPDEVARMAMAYQSPGLCAHYCAAMCEVGKFMKYPDLEYKNLSEIATPLLSALYFLEKANDTIFKILEDHKITSDERKAFSDILTKLEKVSQSSDSLMLWAKQQGLYRESPR